MRYGSNWLRLGILWGLASCGCVPAPGPSRYQVTLPELTARPTDYQFAEGEWYRCYVREDALALVHELKAACLALGGTSQHCQTEAPARRQ